MNKNLLVGIFLAVALGVGLCMILHYAKQKKKRERAIIGKVLPHIVNFNQKYRTILHDNYVSESLRRAGCEDFKQFDSQRKNINDDYLEHIEKPIVTEFDNFGKILSNQHGELAVMNLDFVKREIASTDLLLSDVDGHSLDEAQRTAVVTDEDSNLVIAGAGSGKTLTIVGKIKYLLKHRNVKPEEILLISFTSKVAKEMMERVSRIGADVQAFTFHQLGLRIIRATSNEQLDVFDENDFNRFIKDYFKNSLAKDASSIKAFIEYFAYYLHIPPNVNNIKSLSDIYEYNRHVDFETMQSKYQYVTESQRENRAEKQTLQGEQVKSVEELTIANYLFLHGIRYEYEKKYPFQPISSNRRAYHPDFYLTDYDIWIEHFGVNKAGEAPWLPYPENIEYINSMKWKQQWHQIQRTKLIETYSWYSAEGSLLEKLEEKLRANGVRIGNVDYGDVFARVYQNNSDTYFKNFFDLCKTFITLFKAKGYTIDDLDHLNIKANDNYSKARTRVFKTIIKPMVTAYHAVLKDSGKIDFSDMILKATDLVRRGQQVEPYKYIIIDEFQDVSMSKMALVKAIVDQTHAHLFCVGDDWQSIYRFTGSDLDIFTNFEKYFGKTEVMRIERTYRNSQGLLDLAADFIQENPKQIRKKLVSDKTCSHPVTFVMHAGNPARAIQKVMDTIISNYGEDKSVMILARTRFDRQSLLQYGLFRNLRSDGDAGLVYVKNPKVKCEYYTAHKSKGLEADNVVILNFSNSPWGFPNQIIDDPMLEMVLSDADAYPYGEERRLMYVALTRTRNKVFIITDKSKPSVFLHDFEAEISKGINAQKYDMDRGISNKITKCPKCGGVLLERVSEKGTRFVGCTNFPQCKFTSNNLHLLLQDT